MNKLFALVLFSLTVNLCKASHTLPPPIDDEQANSPFPGVNTSSLRASDPLVPASQTLDEFKGNWRCVFFLKNGTKITHDPEFLKIGSEKVASHYKISGSYGGMRLTPQGLKLSVNLTPDEFLDALIASGIYQGPFSTGSLRIKYLTSTIRKSSSMNFRPAD